LGAKITIGAFTFIFERQHPKTAILPTMITVCGRNCSFFKHFRPQTVIMTRKSRADKIHPSHSGTPPRQARTRKTNPASPPPPQPS
jgi:hypothetical protein